MQHPEFTVRDGGIFDSCNSLAEAKAMLDNLLVDIERQMVAEALRMAEGLHIAPSDAVAVAREEVEGTRTRLTKVLNECGRWPEAVH